MHLQLESGSKTFRLDEQQRVGFGYQVHTGVLGLGLPAVSTHWLEGAGDGAIFRGSRVNPRDIDLPLSILTTGREDLKARMSDLALALARECTLRLVEDDGSSWWCKVHRVGGGNYTYGVDTIGENEVKLVVTVRSGDPYWTAEMPLQSVVSKGEVRGLLPKLSSLQISSSQASGTIDLENPGDVDAQPRWVIYGPGDNFRAVSPRGEVLHWTGSLTEGQSLTINTTDGSVRDNTGASRYSELAPAPRMWRVPPGLTIAEASLQNSTADSRIVCTWRPRRWLVI